MTRRFTYAYAGVDRELRAESKKMLQLLTKTYRFNPHGEIIKLPYGNIFPIGENRYLDFVIEGIGTKVLVAQLAEKYDTIAIDGIAMAVNDVIRSGARPFAIADNIHLHASNPTLIEGLIKGIVRGAAEAECIVPSGEIGDVSELIKGVSEDKCFDMIFAAIGEVKSKDIIFGRNIKPGDAIIGLRSSGIHSNGVSLARKILFKLWGGKYEPCDIPVGLNREIVYEVLEPTEIYVKPVLTVMKTINVKAAVHITGDAYLKFDRLSKFSRNIGFEFNNFRPQPIFELLQRTASELGGLLTDEEMFKTFNMGWGFALILDKKDIDQALDFLEEAGVQAEQIGWVTNSEGIKILYKKRKIILK